MAEHPDEYLHHHHMNFFPLAIIALLFSGTSLLFAQNYEVPPVLNASEFLEKEWLKSEFHEVVPEVNTAGMLNHYKVKSSVGSFEVLGTEMVKVRIREIHAIEKLKKKRAPGAAAKGLGKQIKFEAEVLGKVITKPVQSAIAIPQGIGSFIKRSASSVKNKVKAGGNYKGGPLQDWFQISEYKLDWADKLGVNPYTDNEVLQKHLNRVSGSSAVGGLGLRILIPGDGLIVAADEGRKAKELQDVYLTPPTKLFTENHKALMAMGIAPGIVDQFLGNSAYTPASQAIIVRALSTMDGAKSIDQFIAQANEADCLIDVLFYQRSAEMLAWYHLAVEKIAEYRITERDLPVAISTKGNLIVPLYFDYASWSKDASGFAHSFTTFGKKTGTKKTVIVTPGRFSKRASRELKSLGFETMQPSL